MKEMNLGSQLARGDYIELRMGKSFEASQWLIDNENAVVKHIEK